MSATNGTHSSHAASRLTSPIIRVIRTRICARPLSLCNLSGSGGIRRRLTSPKTHRGGRRNRAGHARSRGTGRTSRSLVGETAVGAETILTVCVGLRHTVHRLEDGINPTFNSYLRDEDSPRWRKEPR